MKLVSGWRRWIAGGLILYIASFLAPAYAVDGDSLSGWWAFRFALDGSLFAKVSACTNLAMISCLVLGWRSSRKGEGWGLAALVASVILNTWWFILDDHPIQHLQVGYYLWLASFLVVIGALRVRTNEPMKQSVADPSWQAY